jgi:acyl carrier protein
MLPGTYVELPRLPLSANGKIDRKDLPDPPPEPMRATAHVAPATPTEEVLERLWAQTLGLAQISTHDSLFDVGGDSLTATRIVAQIRDVLEVELRLVDFFEVPTIAGVAARVDEMRVGVEA